MIGVVALALNADAIRCCALLHEVAMYDPEAMIR